VTSVVKGGLSLRAKILPYAYGGWFSSLFRSQGGKHKNNINI